MELIVSCEYGDFRLSFVMKGNCWKVGNYSLIPSKVFAVRYNPEVDD